MKKSKPEYGTSHRLGKVVDGIQIWANIDHDLLLAVLLPALLFERIFNGGAPDKEMYGSYNNSCWDRGFSIHIHSWRGNEDLHRHVFMGFFVWDPLVGPHTRQWLVGQSFCCLDAIQQAVNSGRPRWSWSTGGNNTGTHGLWIQIRTKMQLWNTC